MTVRILTILLLRVLSAVCFDNAVIDDAIADLVERCFARKAIAQRNHIGLALRAFLRLERYCFSNGISWFEAKTNIIREAVRAYLAKPIYTLKPTA